MSTADLCDEFGDKCLYPIHANLKSYGQPRFEGKIFTVRCFQDNSMLRAMLKSNPEPCDKVLVVDGGGDLRYALLGDQLAKFGIENGWKGVIVNGCIRDSKEINALDFGVKALGTNPRKTEKKGEGNQSVVLKVFGEEIKPGDYLVADEDGIVIGYADELASKFK